jgi:perosamine synthetase
VTVQPIRYPVSKPSLGEREQELLLETFKSGQITHGPRVEEFERVFATRLGVADAVAVANGTVAIHLALAGINVGQGDEVLVPNLSFVATANAVSYTGATPVLCDIDPIDWGISVDDMRRKVSEKTKAVVVVHLYGKPANMEGILKFAREYRLFVIEDAAEGLGGTYKGRALGTIGFGGTFSFYGNKIITTGEGGMVVTSDRSYAKRLRLLRGQAQSPHQRYFHGEIGFNYRMTELQAALGVAQTERMPSLIKRRRAILDLYAAQLKTWGLQYGVTSGPDVAPWLFTFYVPRNVHRDDLMIHLSQNGVDTRAIFHTMNRLPMYSRPDHQFPVSTELSDRGLSLPTYPDLEPADVERICNLVGEFVSHSVTPSKGA